MKRLKARQQGVNGNFENQNEETEGKPRFESLDVDF